MENKMQKKIARHHAFSAVARPSKMENQGLFSFPG
jgi:hypothetical protein